MVPLKTTNVILWRIAPNAEATEDVRNVMVAAMWIVMCATAVDNARIVMAMAVHVVQNVVVTEDVGIVAAREKLYAEIAMVLEKFIMVTIM